MYAVIKIKGHQYLVQKGDLLRVDKIARAEQGSTVIFRDVYLVFDDNKLEIGDPLVKGAVVEAEVIRHLRGRKMIILKYGPKTRRRVKKGFRPEYTELKITSISS